MSTGEIYFVYEPVQKKIANYGKTAEYILKVFLNYFVILKQHQRNNSSKNNNKMQF